MSIAIEQTAEEVTQAFEVNQNSQLRTIRLSEANVWSISPTSELGENFNLKISFETAERNVDDHRMLLPINFIFDLFETPESANKYVVRINCKFEAHYALRPKYTPDPSHVKAFHEGNAVFNCWPFFREYVQNTVVRMGYPAPPIEFLRLSRKNEGLKKPTKLEAATVATAKKKRTVKS